MWIAGWSEFGIVGSLTLCLVGSVRTIRDAVAEEGLVDAGSVSAGSLGDAGAGFGLGGGRPADVRVAVQVFAVGHLEKKIKIRYSRNTVKSRFYFKSRFMVKSLMTKFKVY